MLGLFALKNLKVLSQTNNFQVKVYESETIHKTRKLKVTAKNFKSL